MSRNVSRILIIKPGAIGDLLMLTPVIRALRGSFPQSEITILVGGHASTDLFRYHPDVHQSVIFEKKGEHRSFSGLLKLWQRLRKEHFDLVLNFQRSNLKAWLLATAASPCRVLVYHKSRRLGIHAVQDHLKTLAPLGTGPETADQRLELHWSDAEERWASELLKGQSTLGPLVALNLGASHPVNRWPAAHFSQLMTLLKTELGAGILLLGGEQDRSLADAVLAQTDIGVTDLVGRTTLLRLGAVLKRCAVVVSGDTGPMHMATAVGTPVIALFGAADPARTGPVGTGHTVLQAKGVTCIPCRSRKCRNPIYLECMTSISPRDVLDVIVNKIGFCGIAAEV